MLDGVILNNHELEKENELESWKDTFIKLYENDNINFLNKLRGSFCGVIYDTAKKELTLFTDQIMSKCVYYSLQGDKLIFSTDISYLASLDKKENRLDEDAAYLLLTFGGTLEERTLFKNIRKLNYGTIFKIDSNKNIDKKNYYEIDNKTDISITKEKAITKIDELFRKAIKLEYEKDKEYGYNHLVALSAGRDSRMNTWVAQVMGYKEKVLNITFSESNELDEIIPKQIAKDLKHEWIFKSLDNGNCCYLIDDVIKKSCGEVHAGTLIHSYIMMKDLNYNNFGILHNGIGGDIISAYGNKTKKVSNENIMEFKKLYSSKLLKKVKQKNIINNFYENEDVFNNINRGFHVTYLSSLLLQDKLELVSPFLYLELFKFCMKIPYEIMRGNTLYDTWISKKYPEAAKYSHNGREIGEKEIKILGRSVPVSQIIPRILKKIGITKGKKGMNPFDEWYKNNIEVKEYIDSYYKKNNNLLDNYSELKKDVEFMWVKGNSREKIQILTLLGVLKLYF